GDHRRDVGVQDAARNEVELEQPTLGDDRVARVVASLVADHHVHPIGEVVDRFALALVTPLGPEYDGGRHGVFSLRDTAGPPPWRSGSGGHVGAFGGGLAADKERLGVTEIDVDRVAFHDAHEVVVRYVR